jgi:hypothetical protein
VSAPVSIRAQQDFEARQAETARIAAEMVALTGCSQAAAICAAGSFMNFKPGYNGDHGIDPGAAPVGFSAMWSEALSALRVWKMAQRQVSVAA